jgi:hypothetical protein
MKTALLSSSSGKSLELLLELAKKLGIKATILSEEQLEDAGLAKAMKEGRTGKHVDTAKFMKSLK